MQKCLSGVEMRLVRWPPEFGRRVEPTLTRGDISITSHSGALRGVYKTLGVPARQLVVGEMNVLVVRVREVVA